jgi:glutamine synthetase
MKEVLGEHIHEYLVEAKTREWKEFLLQVTKWEIDRQFEVL